ncbi:hypothetical protein [Nevskia soli]|uniref:hypothetical protein n=1 Tax=Nevskia soli TaxID=418856 RepID=UPI0012FBF5F3|nr:hypothetical protein [Nevskia soli]
MRKRSEVHCGSDSQPFDRVDVHRQTQSILLLKAEAQRQTSLMTYQDGYAIELGDVVCVPVPGGTAKARVVMLGATYEHLDIDKQFLSWVKEKKVLDASSIVIEWLGPNPFAHNDPRHAPVGNYMFSPVDEHVQRIA